MKRYMTMAGLLAAGLAPFPAAAGSIVVPYWTPIPIRITQDVTSRDALLGQTVAAEIAEDVAIDGRVVFRQGMPVWADVSHVRKKKGFGVPGQIEVRMIFATAGTGSVHIAGGIKSRGASGGANVAAAWVAGGVLGAFVVTGRSGEIAAGTTLIARVDEEKPVEIASAVGSAAIESGYEVAVRR